MHLSLGTTIIIIHFQQLISLEWWIIINNHQPFIANYGYELKYEIQSKHNSIRYINNILATITVWALLYNTQTFNMPSLITKLDMLM